MIARVIAFVIMLSPLYAHAQLKIGGSLFTGKNTYFDTSNKKFTDLRYLDAPFVGASIHLRYNKIRLEFSRSILDSAKEKTHRSLDVDDTIISQVRVSGHAYDDPTDLRLYYDGIELNHIGFSPFIGLNWQGGSPGRGESGIKIEDEQGIELVNLITTNNEPSGNPVSYTIGTEFYLPHFTKGKVRFFTAFNYRPGYYVRGTVSGQAYGQSVLEEHKIQGWSSSFGLRIVFR